MVIGLAHLMSFTLKVPNLLSFVAEELVKKSPDMINSLKAAVKNHHVDVKFSDVWWENALNCSLFPRPVSVFLPVTDSFDHSTYFS